MMLTGVVYDEYDEDVTIEDFGADAMAAVQRLDVPYVIDGRPFAPASMAKLVTTLAMKAHERGRPFVADSALQLLATWSGIPNPTFAGQIPSESEVKTVAEYAVRLSQLPWRPSIKYVYGHDVDGVPGAARRGISVDEQRIDWMQRFLSKDGFGPRDPDADRDALAARWTAGASMHARVGAAIEFAKLGDLSTRDALLDMLVARVEDEGLAIDLQHLVVSIASESTVLDARFAEFASRIVDTPLYLLAGSGSALLVRAAVPIYLGLAQSLEDGPHEYLEAATHSVRALTGVVEFDDLLDDDDEATIETWGAQAMDVVSALDATYVADGAPFTPASTAKLLTGFAMRSEQTGRPFIGTALGERLATWSGIACPITDDRVLTQNDVRSLVEYATTLSRLPWRPGVKYFYGHDVDGGPGLHDVT